MQDANPHSYAPAPRKSQGGDFVSERISTYDERSGI